MSFKEAYEYYTHADLNSYQADSNAGYGGGQETYYPPGMHTSYGPQVGPSSSAWFGYEDLVMQSVADLSNRVTTLSMQ